MLLTGLQRHAQRLIALSVDRYTDNTAWNRALVGIAGCKESRMWATKAHRNTKVLSVAQDDVCTHFTRRFDLDERHQVAGNRGQSVLFMQGTDDIREISDFPLTPRVLEQSTEDVMVCRFLCRADDDVPTEGFCASTDNVDGLWQTQLINIEGV